MDLDPGTSFGTNAGVGTSQQGQSSSQRSTGTPGIIPGTMDLYSQLLGLNQQNYNTMLGGYGSAGQNLAQRLGQIQGGYGDLGARVGQAGGTALDWQTGGGNNIQRGYDELMRSVMGNIQGTDASQRQAIQDAYRAQQGQVTQQMLNAGLGNTTVAGTMQRGPMLDAQKANIALSNQMAQLMAGYQSQIGGAKLGYLNQLNQQNVAQQNLMAQRMQEIGMAGLGQQMSGLGMQNQMAETLLRSLAGYRFQNTFGNMTGQTSESQGGGGGFGSSQQRQGGQQGSRQANPQSPYGGTGNFAYNQGASGTMFQGGEPGTADQAAGYDPAFPYAGVGVGGWGNVGAAAEAPSYDPYAGIGWSNLGDVGSFGAYGGE